MKSKKDAKFEPDPLRGGTEGTLYSYPGPGLEALELGGPRYGYCFKFHPMPLYL